MQDNEEIADYLKGFDYSVGNQPCFKCRWFVPDEATMDDLDADIRLEDIVGRCRRFPGRHDGLHDGLKGTCIVDTCGEWMERNQPLKAESAGDSSTVSPFTPASRHARHCMAELIRTESDSDDGTIYVPSLSDIISGRSYGPNHLDGKLLADLIDA